MAVNVIIGLVDSDADQIITEGGGGGGVSDGDKGDIVVSAGGTVWTIDSGVVTAAKIDPAAVLGNNARVAVSKNSGATVGLRRRINFVEGSNVTLTVADDAGNEEVDVTIAASGGGGGVNEGYVFFLGGAS